MSFLTKRDGNRLGYAPVMRIGKRRRRRGGMGTENEQGMVGEREE